MCSTYSGSQSIILICGIVALFTHCICVCVNLKVNCSAPYLTFDFESDSVLPCCVISSPGINNCSELFLIPDQIRCCRADAFLIRDWKRLRPFPIPDQKWKCRRVCVCMCAGVRACLLACVRACVRACVCVVCACVRACQRSC
jgi:hypothetical protein